MRICELKQKEVINSCDCKRLGFVDDLVFDICTGKIHAIVVAGPGKFCGLVCSEYEYVIPFACVVQIGDDIILVKVKEEDVKQRVKIT